MLSVNNNITKMTQKALKVFVNEIYSNRPEKNFNTKKTDVYQMITFGV